MVSSAAVLGVTIGSLVVMTVIGLWYSHGRVQSVEDLIAARDSADQSRTTATLIASVMGVWILLSAPEAGALFGIAAVIGYAIGESVPMLIYSKIGPRIRSVIPAGHSLTEYALARYGRGMYAFVLSVSVLYMFVFLAAELTGISLALHHVAAIPQWQTAVLVGGFVLLYTGYGGLRASIFTDTLQTLLILPLLVGSVTAIVFVLGGTASIHHGIANANPTLLDIGYVPGIRFGIALVFAIAGAELINQTWWQRIYAAQDSAIVERGFRTAMVANGLILVLATLLGVVAVGHADVVTAFGSERYNAGIAFFILVEAAFAEWVLVGVLLLALMLVMSTADTLFNALSSLVTIDVSRVLSDPNDRALRWSARLLTLIVAVAAIAVSVRARSVLRLFFVADLLGAAVAFPLLYGLYNERLTGAGAFGSSVVGLAVGAAFFPFPFGLHPKIDGLFWGLLPPPDTTYLLPFGGAFLVSIAMTVMVSRLSRHRYDLDDMSREIRRLDDPVTDGGLNRHADADGGHSDRGMR